MKDVVEKLQALPTVEPPADLASKIMNSLPRRRGLLGHIEYAASRTFAGHPKSLFLPASPAELGLFVLSIGLFFCCLTAVIWLRLPFMVRQQAFLPTLAASIILMVIGWRQIRSSRLVITFWPGLAAACALFSVTLALGLSGLGLELRLVAVWLGMSGLAVVCGLGMVLAVPSVPTTTPPPSALPPAAAVT